MSDVTIKFEGDITALNKVIDDLAKTGKRAADSVQKPMDKLLETDKKVERSMSNIAKAIGSAATPAEGLVNILDGIEGVFNTSLIVGASAAIGVALNQALTNAAKGMDTFSAKAEGTLSKPFKGTADDIDAIHTAIADMAADIGDDGLFERLIFGGQKEELLAAQEKSLELAKRFVAAKKEIESGKAADMGFFRNRSLAAKSVQDDGTLAGGERAKRAEEESRILDLQIKQVEELAVAEDKLKAVREDSLSTDLTKKYQQEIFDQVVSRHKIEINSLNEEILLARDRRILELDLYQQGQQHAIEQLTFMNEQEKAMLILEQAGEKLNLLSSARGATEKEIAAAVLEQARAKAAVEALSREEAKASAEITQILLERRQLGKSDIDQQRVRVNILEGVARAELEAAKTQKEKLDAEKKLSEAQQERLKLKEMERAEDEKMRDIAHERAQMAERDPYVRAQNAARFAQEKADMIAGQPGVSRAEIAQANLNAERARRALIDAAINAAPSLDDVAGTDPDSMRGLRRRAGRGGPNRYSQADQAQALHGLADAQYAADPYGAGRERSKRTRRRARMAEERAKGVLDQSGKADDNRKLEGMTDEEFEEAIDQRRHEKEQRARDRETQKEREKWERENPLDAKKKREGKDYDKSKEPKAKDDGHGKETEAKRKPEAEGDSVVSVLQTIAGWGSGTGVLQDINKKLPMRVLK